MLEELATLRITRSNFLRLLEGYTFDQLNVIPKGYNNSLAWHLGHIVVTQQLLTYRMAGLDCLVSDELIDKYRKGTKPTSPTSLAEVKELKGLLISLVDAAEEDVKAGKFQSYKEYETSYGVVLKTNEESFKFNNVHEALHLGYVMAQRKLV